MHTSKKSPLIVGASLLFAATACGDTDYSGPDSTDRAETTQTSSTTSGTSSPPKEGDLCDAPTDTSTFPVSEESFECDPEENTVFYCNRDGVLQEYPSNGDLFCDCGQDGRVFCGTPGFIGIASRKHRDQALPLRRIS